MEIVAATLGVLWAPRRPAAGRLTRLQGERPKQWARRADFCRFRLARDWPAGQTAGRVAGQLAGGFRDGPNLRANATSPPEPAKPANDLLCSPLFASAKLLESRGAELRRTLFSLRQLFQVSGDGGGRLREPIARGLNR